MERNTRKLANDNLVFNQTNNSQTFLFDLHKNAKKEKIKSDHTALRKFTFVGDSDPQAVGTDAVPEGIVRPEKDGHVAHIIEYNKQHDKPEEKIEFVVISGDLTQNSTSHKILGIWGSNELGVFRRDFANPLIDNDIHVLACRGNHDKDAETTGTIVLKFIVRQMNKVSQKVSGSNIINPDSVPVHYRQGVKKWVVKNNGGVLYQEVHHGVRFVSLDVYPNAENLAWMKKHVPNDLPVVLFWHYNVIGPFSVEERDNGFRWWTPEERTQAFDFFEENNYRVLGIVVGHHHDTYHKRFRDIPIYVCGGDDYYRFTIDPDNDFELKAKRVRFANGEPQEKLKMA